VISEIERFLPGAFDAERHFYPRTLNAQIHPLVAGFYRMSTDRLVSRYCSLHPRANAEVLKNILTTAPKYLRWSGSDLINVSCELGIKNKFILETNSCPSGQKSFPALDEESEEGGYRRLMENTFLPLVEKALNRAVPEAVMAVLYDKNPMESSGYAQALATLSGREVLLVPCTRKDPYGFLKVCNRSLYAKLPEGLKPISCAFRYVTQQPWNRLPLDLKTPVLNPVVTCLAGGRNKTAAAKAFDMFNGQFRNFGLEICTPESFTNVDKAQVPRLVAHLGGNAVVKVPYLNAGQGIFTIVNARELDAFMASDHLYNNFVVQQLVGNKAWSSNHGSTFNIGTVPDNEVRTYVFDMRVMISWQRDRYAPVGMYARRAQHPMTEELPSGTSSWQMLGTNLSVKIGDEQWDTEPRRLLMFDRKDFTKLGLGLDDLIDAFVQSVMANRAIDDLAQHLMTRAGSFRSNLFRSINDDAQLMAEIQMGTPRKGSADEARW
jgi:hypothetical protein